MRMLFPTPVHSLLLFAVWLLLNQSISPGHLLLGGVLAILIPLLTNRLRNPHPGIRRPFKALLYLMRVLIDILIANLQVALLIIRPRMALKPSFVSVPLDITGDLPITVLASTITLTPGTVSADVSDDRSRLLLHALHVEDEEELIRTVKARYETPLKEIFGC